MSASKKTPAAKGKAQAKRNPLASLKLANMVVSKPVLPAEILDRVTYYLDIPTLLRFARLSRRSNEMVYDDAKWQRRLRSMGCWDEAKVRQNADTHKDGIWAAGHRRRSTIDSQTLNGVGHIRKPSLTTISKDVRADDGFDTINLGQSKVLAKPTQTHSEYALNVLESVQSIRGHARKEYAKVYAALIPYYKDILANPSTTSLVFHAFPAPEQQAKMLSIMRIFSHSDFSPGVMARERIIEETISMFSTAALLEFRKGYEYKDIQGRMKQYAYVMDTLDGGRNGIELFLNDNRLLANKSRLGTVSDCIDYSLGYGELSLERVQAYFERLGSAYAQEAATIQAVFPNAGEVSIMFLEKIAEEVLKPFLSALFSDAQTRSTSMYLRVISGTFAAVKQFLLTYTIPANSDDSTTLRANRVMIRVYQEHIDNYLDQELAFFRQKADKEVQQWDQALQDQDTSTETYLMSNINRQADKKDFLSSFKQVIMMPVNILPKMSMGRTKGTMDDEANLTVRNARSGASSPLPRATTPTLPQEAPTTELAAKAALMATRLEGIKSLFSIEVALNLVHAAKSSLERAAQFVSLGSDLGEKARKQGSTIYVLLLDTIGNRHVKSGFDKAIDHLSAYNPRETREQNKDAQDTYQRPMVAPLTTFLELVNVGDLIQQMLDVFFESELVANKIVARDDFLEPAIKEKRKFEAMLDERVAAGLSKGIDVLMDEVEYICATEQQASDYNPAMFDATAGAITTLAPSGTAASMRTTMGAQDIDLNPTRACRHIIALIKAHHSMLQGTTDKTLLDVFTSELSQRLFSTLCKHIKRLRISSTGAIKLLTDLSQYSQFIAGFKNIELNRLFDALRDIGQIYLFEGSNDKEVREMCEIIADRERYRGVFVTEEVIEFCERRVDWYTVRSRVEGKIRGESCTVM